MAEDPTKPSKRRPDGPTWASEGKRSIKERLSEAVRGTLPMIRSRFETYGDAYYIDRAPGTFVLRHPDHIHEVLVTRGADFIKRSKDLEPFLGEGLLTSNGELWRRQRRLIQPAFRREKLMRYAETMVLETQAMLAGWQDGEVRDLGREMMEVTLAVVAKTLLNQPAADAESVAECMAALQDVTSTPDLLPKWLPTPMRRRRDRAAKQLDDLIYPIIDGAEADAEADHLLGQLKHASDEAGQMSRRQLRDELVTLFLAGHETTALSLTWVFYLLARHPAQEELLHEEVDRVLDGRPPTYAELETLEFTELCFKEALRLFPPIFILPRVAVRDTKIGDWDVDAGAEVINWVYFCHRDARWFPNPDAFVPARFIPESEGVLHPHAFLPFGAGMRQCIGSHFAMIEGTLLLAAIAQKYRVRLADDRQVELNPRVTLAPRAPIKMRLERR